MNPFVLSVGQCDFDHGNISRLLQREFGAKVERAALADEAIAAAGRARYDLVLVNRILDSDGSTGLEVIRRLRESPATTDLPVMLVSNFADAQEQAVALGARPGFGKNGLEDGSTIARLRQVLGRSEQP